MGTPSCKLAGARTPSIFTAARCRALAEIAALADPDAIIASNNTTFRHFASHVSRRVPDNSFMGYDPDNRVTLVIWTNLTVSLDEKPTANTLMLKVLDQIYVVSPLR
jgi:hypothetical protein